MLNKFNCSHDLVSAVTGAIAEKLSRYHQLSELPFPHCFVFAGSHSARNGVDILVHPAVLDSIIPEFDSRLAEDWNKG